MIGFVLNSLWVTLALTALGSLAVCERRRGERCTTRAVSRRFLAVALAALFLFPCVSTTDDLLTMAALQHAASNNAEPGNASCRLTRGGAHHAQLDRLFADLQNFYLPLPSVVPGSGVTVSRLLPSLLPCESQAGLPAFSGRAPPHSVLS